MCVRVGLLLVGLLFSVNCKSSGGAMSGLAAPANQEPGALPNVSSSVAPVGQSSASTKVTHPAFSSQAIQILGTVCSLSPKDAQPISPQPQDLGPQKLNHVEGPVRDVPELDSLRDLFKRPLGERIGRLALSVTAAGLDECELLGVWLEQSYADGLKHLCVAPVASDGRVPKPYSDQHIYNRQAQKVLRQFNKADAEKKRTIMREAMARGEATFACALLTKQ